MILIPTLGLIAALLMDKGDEVKTEKQAVCLLIPASIMILAVLTNDFHQKVFYFPEGFLLSNEIYSLWACVFHHSGMDDVLYDYNGSRSGL